MSLLPMLYSNWWEELDRSHWLVDQNFGMSLSPDEILTRSVLPFDSDVVVVRPRRRMHNRYQPYDRSLSRRSTGASIVKADKDKFHVTLDVQQFAPEEVSVKVVGKNVVVEGKHEDKQDEHGFISRQFVRKYLIPEQCDIERLESTLSSDGVLTITSPRKPVDTEKNERVIKIQRTGQPAIRDEAVKSGDQQQGSQTQKSPSQQKVQEKTVKAA